MNKFIIAAAAVALATPAAAQISPNQDLTINVNASVAGQCGVFNQSNVAGGNPVTTINFGDLAATPAANTVTAPAFSALYICNSANGFSRAISSANGGSLWRAGTSGGANNAIPYTLQHGGGSGLGFAAQQLTATRTDTFGGSAAYLAGQAGSITLRVNGVQVPSAANAAFNTTSVFAGNYADVVTVDITAN
ncbi:MAG: spore coat protein U domain-containing protein [Brevundimonas sp.]|jgi:hypothetical protein|uniref:hypothetical protein n=1 Tax=Brevundimonas sp. TaxID=1871086 RepID=UPI001A243633|nr:hypothetical protein [Brevundimonas sp.]MBJ7447906.1 spore coat protein U domain-containing protein [Brevundimonas sp.]